MKKTLIVMLILGLVAGSLAAPAAAKKKKKKKYVNGQGVTVVCRGAKSKVLSK